MKKIVLFGGLAAFGILVGVVLIVGRGPEPQHPYMYSDPEKSAPDAQVTKEGIIKNIDYYVALIDSAQADPYRQVTKESFVLKASEMKDRIQRLQIDTIPLIECYYDMQELAAFLQDEHAEIEFQPEWQKSYPDRFPLDIRIYEKKAYVRQDLSEAGIPHYAELVRIADKPVEEMLLETQKLIHVTLLLVSNFTNSAAVVFSAIFKSNKLGTIIGQETGGRETFTSDSILIQMPNSRLLASVPVAILALPGENPDRGVLPDVEVEYSLADKMSNKDLDLERVKELIKKLVLGCAGRVGILGSTFPSIIEGKGKPNLEEMSKMALKFRTQFDMALMPYNNSIEWI